MFKIIEGTTDCQIRSVIRFLNARNVLPSEIHHQICQVCGGTKKIRLFAFATVLAKDRH